MTPNMLVDELVDFIKPLVVHYRMKSEAGENKAPQVVPGYLKKETLRREDKTDGDLPYILVRFLNLIDEDHGSTATIHIETVTISEDIQNGWRDVTNILTHIRNELLSKRRVGKSFSLQLPLHIDLPVEQAFPVHAGVITAQFFIPQPQDNTI